MGDKTYSTSEVASMLEKHPKTINYYHNKYGFGEMQGRDLRFTDREMKKIIQIMGEK
ncbi:MAG: hypothetical protein PF693_09930 [Spirochaetia bacterium]|jgi:hypothetical protein|nr:hypothetical protein [Spirochaetia bacterium]